METKKVSDCHGKEILVEHDENICESCNRVCTPVSEPTLRDWEDKFDIEMLKFLEYLGLKTALLRNRPTEALYPEFGTLKSVFREILSSRDAALLEFIESKKVSEYGAVSGTHLEYEEGFNGGLSVIASHIRHDL